MYKFMHYALQQKMVKTNIQNKIAYMYDTKANTFSQIAKLFKMLHYNKLDIKNRFIENKNTKLQRSFTLQLTLYVIFLT